MLALYRAYFVDDQDISSPETTADVLATLGLERAKVLAALGDPAIKERLKQETQAGHRPRCIRLTLYHRRRRAVLGS